MALPAPIAALMLDGGDPRADPKETVGFSHTETPVHANNVTLEEYLHYAFITRAEEKEANERYRAAKAPLTRKTILRERFSKRFGGRHDQRDDAGGGQAHADGELGGGMEECESRCQDCWPGKRLLSYRDRRSRSFPGTVSVFSKAIQGYRDDEPDETL